MMKFFINILIISQVCFYSSVFSQTSKVTISETDSGFELFRDNKPYYIKGAGAKNNFKKVKESGGNSIRIWSSNKSKLLDSALKYDLSVCLGLWVGQERSGFDYNDEYKVKAQIDLGFLYIHQQFVSINKDAMLQKLKVK